MNSLVFTTVQHITNRTSESRLVKVSTQGRRWSQRNWLYPLPHWAQRRCFESSPAIRLANIGLSDPVNGTDKLTSPCGKCLHGDVTEWRLDDFFGVMVWSCKPGSCQLGQEELIEG